MRHQGKRRGWSQGGPVKKRRTGFLQPCFLFLGLLLFQAGLAYSVNSDFNPLNSAGIGFLQIIRMYCQALRTQTVNQATIYAMKMWV